MQVFAIILATLFWFEFLVINGVAYGVLGGLIWWFTRRLGDLSYVLAIGVVVMVIIVTPALINRHVDQKIEDLMRTGVAPFPLVKKPHIIALLDEDYRIERNTNRGVIVEDQPPTACSEMCLRLLYDAQVDAVIIGSSPENSENPLEATHLWRYELRRVLPCTAKTDALSDPRRNSRHAIPLEFQNDIISRASQLMAQGLCPVRNQGKITEADVVLLSKRGEHYHDSVVQTRISRADTYSVFLRQKDIFVKKMKAINGDVIYSDKPFFYYTPYTTKTRYDRIRSFRTDWYLDDMPYITLAPWLKPKIPD